MVALDIGHSITAALPFSTTAIILLRFSHLILGGTLVSTEYACYAIYPLLWSLDRRVDNLLRRVIYAQDLWHSGDRLREIADRPEC